MVWKLHSFDSVSWSPKATKLIEEGPLSGSASQTNAPTATAGFGPTLTACLYFDGERGVTSMLLGNMMRASPKWPVGTVCLNGIDHPDLDDRALLLQFGSLIDCVHSGVHCRAPGQVRS